MALIYKKVSAIKKIEKISPILFYPVSSGFVLESMLEAIESLPTSETSFNL